MISEKEASADGGVFSVKYKIENPIEGVSLSHNTDAEWIDGFDYSAENIVSFSIAPNMEEVTRNSFIYFSYADIRDTVSVLQTGIEASTFRIIEEAIGPDFITVSIVPSDLSMTYMFGVIPKSEINVFPDDETFVSDYLIPYYNDQATAKGVTIQEYLNDMLMSGEQGGSVRGLLSSTEYVAFAFGLTAEAEVLTELAKLEFTTESLPDFDCAISTEIDGPDVKLNVSPTDDEQMYYIAIFEGQGHDNATLSASAQASIEAEIMGLMIWGIPREDAVQAVTHKGDFTLEQMLDSETEYTGIAIAVDANGIVSSNPVIDEFKTGKAALSDIEITVDYTSIAGRKAEFTVTPSNEDTYVFFTYSVKDIESLNLKSDDEIIEYICSTQKLAHYTRRGAVETYRDGLRPNTEYVVYSFGCHGVVPTTGLFESTFTTTDAQTNGSTFKYEFGPYYNGDEAAIKYPNTFSAAVGGVVFPAKGVFTGDYWGIYHKLYEGDLREYDKEDVYQVLKNDGYPGFQSDMMYVCNYDKVYTLCGFVETQEGNYSELYLEVVGPFTKEGCAPIDELAGPGLSSEVPLYSPERFVSLKPSILPDSESDLFCKEGKAKTDENSLVPVKSVSPISKAVHPEIYTFLR